MPLSCLCHAFVMPLSCLCHASVMPLSCLCHSLCHASVMPLSCLCHSLCHGTRYQQLYQPPDTIPNVLLLSTNVVTNNIVRNNRTTPTVDRLLSLCVCGGGGGGGGGGGVYVWDQHTGQCTGQCGDRIGQAKDCYMSLLLLGDTDSTDRYSGNLTARQHGIFPVKTVPLKINN